MFPDLGKVTLCNRCPGGSTVHSPLIIRAICSRGAPYVGCMGPFCSGSGPDPGWLSGPASWGGCDLLVGRVRPQSGQLWDPGAPSWCWPACWQIISGANRQAWSSKMVLSSTSVLVVEWAYQNCCHKCLCPQEEHWLPSASPGDSPRSAGVSDPDSFQITTSVLGSEDGRFCICPLRVELLFSTAL